ncbi:MAG: hypothetical protein ACLTZM_02510 [Ruminococcus sp.]
MGLPISAVSITSSGARRTRKRRIFPDHFPLPKCHCHSPGSLPAVHLEAAFFVWHPSVDHRGHFRSGFSCGIPPRSTKNKKYEEKEKAASWKGLFFYNRQYRRKLNEFLNIHDIFHAVS